MWALDADRVDSGGLGIRLSVAGEPFGEQGYPLRPGRLVVADATAVQGLLFGALAPGHEISRRTAPHGPVHGRGRGRAGHPPGGGAVGLPGPPASAVRACPLGVRPMVGLSSPPRGESMELLEQEIGVRLARPADPAGSGRTGRPTGRRAGCPPLDAGADRPARA